MSRQAQRLVTTTELGLLRADEHDLRYDSGKLLDRVARDHPRASGDIREHLHPTGAASAPHRAAANVAGARARSSRDASGRWLGALDVRVDAVQVLDPEGRVAPRRSTPEVDGEREYIASPGADHQEVMRPQDSTIMRSWS